MAQVYDFARELYKSKELDSKKDMSKGEMLDAVSRFINGQGNQAGLEALADVLVNLIENAYSSKGMDNFEQFDSSTAYVAGDIVRYGNGIYIFTNDHEGEWDESDVEQTTLWDLENHETVRVSFSAFESFRVIISPESEFTAAVVRRIMDSQRPTIAFDDFTVTYIGRWETIDSSYGEPAVGFFALYPYLEADGVEKMKIAFLTINERVVEQDVYTFHQWLEQ